MRKVIVIVGIAVLFLYALVNLGWGTGSSGNHLVEVSDDLLGLQWAVQRVNGWVNFFPQADLSKEKHYPHISITLTVKNMTANPKHLTAFVELYTEKREMLLGSFYAYFQEIPGGCEAFRRELTLAPGEERQVKLRAWAEGLFADCLPLNTWSSPPTISPEQTVSARIHFITKAGERGVSGQTPPFIIKATH